MQMSISEQLDHIRNDYPEAWAYIKEMLDYREQLGRETALTAELPKFDDNDNMVEV